MMTFQKHLSQGNLPTWKPRYTPRRPKSRWSLINVGKAQALIAAGRMQAPGLAEIHAAQLDGRWDAAYGSQKLLALRGPRIMKFVSFFVATTSQQKKSHKLSKKPVAHSRTTQYDPSEFFCCSVAATKKHTKYHIRRKIICGN
jgi:hypothetical protein